MELPTLPFWVMSNLCILKMYVIFVVSLQFVIQILSSEYYFPASRNVGCRGLVVKTLPQNFCQLKGDVFLDIIPLWGQLISTDW